MELDIMELWFYQKAKMKYCHFRRKVSCKSWELLLKNTTQVHVLYIATDEI